MILLVSSCDGGRRLKDGQATDGGPIREVFLFCSNLPCMTIPYGRCARTHPHPLVFSLLGSAGAVCSPKHAKEGDGVPDPVRCIQPKPRAGDVRHGNVTRAG